MAEAMAANPPFQYTPKSVALCVGSSVAYIVLLKVVFPATKPATKEARAKYESARKWHNLGIFLFSLFCCAYTTLHLHATGDFASFDAWMCTPTDDAIYALHWVFVASKIYEWPVKISHRAIR